MVSGACGRMYCARGEARQWALCTEPNQSHEANHPLSHHHLRRSNVDMDDIRGSLSKMKKKVKHRLTGKRKPDQTEANPGGKKADSTSTLPQPGLRAVVGESHDREGGRADVTDKRVLSMDRPAQLESAPAGGGDNSQEGEEANVGGREVGQRSSQPHPDVDVAVGSGRKGEAESVYPSPSAPSISHGGEPDSAYQMWWFRSLLLIAASDDVDISALLDHGPEVPEVARPDGTLELGTATDEKRSNYKPAASVTTELLRGVRDSAGAFGPLKFVAKSLCSVLDNCEVWPHSRRFDPQHSRSF